MESMSCCDVVHKAFTDNNKLPHDNREFECILSSRIITLHPYNDRDFEWYVPSGSAGFVLMGKRLVAVMNTGNL